MTGFREYVCVCVCGGGGGGGRNHVKACPRGLDFRHNRSLSRGEWNKIKACPEGRGINMYKCVPGGFEI